MRIPFTAWFHFVCGWLICCYFCITEGEEEEDEDGEEEDFDEEEEDEEDEEEVEGEDDDDEVSGEDEVTKNENIFLPEVQMHCF